MRSTHQGGDAILVQLDDLGMRPGVGGVLRAVDGHIAEELNADAIAVSLQCEPLLEEDVLAEDVVAHLHVQIGAVLGNCLGLAQNDVAVRPLRPHIVAEGAFHGGEQGKVLHPIVFAHEGSQLIRQLAFAFFKGTAKQALLVPADGLEFDLLVLAGGVQITVIQGNQALLGQLFDGNQHGVAREYAGGLVGAFTVAGRAHGENLPDAHAALFEEIGKGVCFLAQGSDAARAGQGGDVQQQTALAHLYPSFQMCMETFPKMLERNAGPEPRFISIFFICGKIPAERMKKLLKKRVRMKRTLMNTVDNRKVIGLNSCAGEAPASCQPLTEPAVTPST